MAESHSTAPVTSPIVAAALQPTSERPFVAVIAEATQDELAVIEAGWQAREPSGVRALALSMIDRERRSRVLCPVCGAPVVSRQYYTGGRGYHFVEVCSEDVTHELAASAAAGVITRKAA